MKRLLITLATLLTLLTPALIAPSLHAQEYNQQVACNGLEAAGVDFGGGGVSNSGGDCRPGKSDGPAAQRFPSIFARIINIFSLVVGAASVLMIIIGGFRYIISGGDSSGVQGAKNTLLYALVGLVIVLFAQVIVRFVLSNV